MTFATDLLRKYGHHAPAPPPVPVKHDPEPVSKTEIRRISHVVHYTSRVRKYARQGNSNMRGMHYASTPCIYRYEYGWRVYIPHPVTKTKMLVGVYKEWVRARAGFKLFKYWMRAGFDFDSIPRCISPQFRRHGIVYHDA